MRRLISVVVAASMTLGAGFQTASAGSPAAAPPDPALPEQVEHGVIVELPGGDRFKVWHSDDLRTVWGQRYDAARSSWGARAVVLRKPRLFCGDVDARSAGGAVAVMAKCDHGGYAEDTAPVSSQAVYSRDTAHWSSRRLEGEAYEEPGISPLGTHAVWEQRGGYLTWSPGKGFAAHRLSTPGREYTTTVVITDAGRVSYLYGRTEHDGACDFVSLSRTDEGPSTRQSIDVGDDACADVALVNVDAHTVLLGDLVTPAGTGVLGRPQDLAPWAVTRIAPDSAPGLASYSWRKGWNSTFVGARGLPLTSFGSSDRRTILAQAYDEDAQRWLSPVEVATTTTRCSPGENWTARPLGVTVLQLNCRTPGGDRARVVATTDGHTWHQLPLGRHPLGVSPDGDEVAVPGNRSVTVLSQEAGAVRLAVGATERCDIVVPDGPRAAIRLTSTAWSDGWPRVLQRSTPGGWRHSSTVRLPSRGMCRRAMAEPYDLPMHHSVLGGNEGYGVHVVERGGKWQVRRTRW